MKKNRLAALAFAVLLGAAACSGGTSEDAQETTTTGSEAVDGSTSTTARDSRPRGFGGNRPEAVDSTPDGDVATPAEMAEVNESFEPEAQLRPVESEIPMYEG